MKPRLLDLLVCPRCGGRFDVTSFDAPPSPDVTEGLLRSGCGAVYPIVSTIPRVLDDAFDVYPEFARRYADRLDGVAIPSVARRSRDPIERTRSSFGYQWTVFSEMVIDFRQNFLDYISPVDERFFPGKLGLDAGCGFGRHISNAAQFHAEMVGVDISEAIDSTHQNTKHLPNVHLVQANLYELPFRPGSFDFAYSIGVLHHLPDPEGAFDRLVAVVKPGGSVFVWVYSKARHVVNFALECLRRITTHLPKRGQQALSLAAATIDWCFFIRPYRLLASAPRLAGVAEGLLPRLKVYSAYPFQVVYADWFDRLAAPIRFYYDGNDMRGWLTRAKLERQVISPTGLFGWRAYGERPRADGPATTP